VVEGFTFTNGEGGVLPNCVSGGGPVGGALYVASGGGAPATALTVTNCRFYRNGYGTRVVGGAAIMLYEHAALHLQGCTFEANGLAIGSPDGVTAHGGAIMACLAPTTTP